ncbi:MAG: outer membrane protein [Legionella sp.]
MIKQLIVAGVVACATGTACAGDALFDEGTPIVWNPIITVNAGASWASPGQNQYLYPFSPPNNYYYSHDSHSSAMATGGVFFGLQRFVYPGVIGQLGLGAAGVTDADVSGMLSVNSVPDVGSYSYKVNHARVELKGKLIATCYQTLQPFVSGSVGVGFNQSHDYQPTFIPGLAYKPWFETNSTVAFAYTVGLGVQTMLDAHWQVGAGYEFADLGKSYLGSSDALLSQGQGLTHFYTNSAVFSLSYLFAS